VLIVVAFLAGIIAGISPCVLPVLPVVFFAGAVSSEPGEEAAPSGAAEPAAVRWHRPLAIVAGLVASFTLLVLAGAELLSLLHLPQELLRDLGIALLLLLGIGFLVPALGDLLERPFRRLTASRQASTASGFVMGLALGLVFVPCAGPVLATITVLGASHKVSPETAVIALAFGAGVAVPLLLVALAGDRLVARSKALRTHAGTLRRVGGAAMVLVALGVAVNAFDGLQRAVPGYTSALQRSIEGSGSVTQSLDALKGVSTTSALSSCPQGASELVDCGAAPAFKQIGAWLNTPGGKPLTLASLRGRVVLVDFWTYSCINCQRTLPHVESWYARYRSSGLEVVGVHSPEFAFEHSVPNVAAAARSLGVRYPVAIDDHYGTWNAYGNEYWPAEYLIDASGQIRYVDFGEGGYAQTEALIRQLLVASRPGVRLPPPSDLPDLTPSEQISPETYLGSERSQYLASPQDPADHLEQYSFPSSLTFPAYALRGGWTVSPEDATAADGAGLELAYQAEDVYLVLGGSGEVHIDPGDGAPARTIQVDGFPRLYTLLSSGTREWGTMELEVSPGVQAYDFTFG
jgi:cytochrome c biogenesis protein CcdA/thiol-disulfide isomerase/thioredoxin